MTKEQPHVPRPVEIIYSCSICQKTIAEIYKQPENDLGFRGDALDDTNAKPVTKLWMTTCAHLICSEHLDGGGVPFHPGDEHARVPCPYCSNHGDRTLKELYAIRGFKKGQYDSSIPKEYFDTPPVSFDGTSVGMNALSFHYRQLCQFGTSLYVALNEARMTTIDYRERVRTSEQTARDAQQTNEQLQTRVTQLEQYERKVQDHDARQPDIIRALSVFNDVVDENERLRHQLSAMGYAVPARAWNITKKLELTPTPGAQQLSNSQLTHTREEAEVHRGDIISPQRISPSSGRTISVQHDLVANMHTALSADSRSRKRGSDDDTSSSNKRPTVSSRLGKPDSRGLMPPPPLPFKRPGDVASESGGSMVTHEKPQKIRPAFIHPGRLGQPDVIQPLEDAPDHHELSIDYEQTNQRVNIYERQQSSPMRPRPQQKPFLAEGRTAPPILDPREQTELPSPHSGYHALEQEHLRREPLAEQSMFQQNIREMPHSSYNLAYRGLSDNDLFNSDPGSVVSSQQPRQAAQPRSDPSRVMLPPPRRRSGTSNSNLASPFFGVNRAPTRIGRITLPSRARAGTSTTDHHGLSQPSLNNLSFINQPHHSISNQRLNTGTSYAPSRSPHKSATSRHSFTQRPPTDRHPSRLAGSAAVNAPFRTPVVRGAQPAAPFSDYDQQQRQSIYANQATPRRPLSHYPAGTPMLMPSRATTAMSGNGGGSYGHRTGD